MAKIIMKKEGEKGSSMLEILISVAILATLMIGILQMFSFAYLVNLRSSTQTLESYKCQQVAEIIRMNRQLQISGEVAAPDIGITLQDGFEFQLPYSSTDNYWSVWGPEGANVMENEGSPFRIFVRVVQPAGANFFDVHVASISDDQWRKKGMPNSLWNDGNHLFLGRVEYVSRIF